MSSSLYRPAGEPKYRRAKDFYDGITLAVAAGIRRSSAYKAEQLKLGQDARHVLTAHVAVNVSEQEMKVLAAHKCVKDGLPFWATVALELDNTDSVTVRVVVPLSWNMYDIEDVVADITAREKELSLRALATADTIVAARMVALKKVKSPDQLAAVMPEINPTHVRSYFHKVR